MRLLLAVTLAVLLSAGCGSDADKPLHRQATDAFRHWAESFETAEYSTTAIGVGDRPTGEFEFEGEARYRKDPESVWTILYLEECGSGRGTREFSTASGRGRGIHLGLQLLATCG